MIFTFTIYTDHYQFYLEDAETDVDTTQVWTDEALTNRLGVLPGLIAVSTSRFSGDVPVEINVRPNPPSRESLDRWDHVVECSLAVPSGRIALTSPFSFDEEAPEIAVAPGTYRAFVYYGDLDSILTDDDMVGDDHYRVVLWPGTPITPQVVKRKPLP